MDNNYTSFGASPLMKYKYCPLHSAPITLLVEHPLSEWEVVGSNPAAPYQRCKNRTSSSLADARIKGVVLGNKSKAGKYLLKRYCYVAIKALQSLCCLFQISDVN